MSFFIDETNFLSGLGLGSLFEHRNEIEIKIRTILPYKHTINVEGSDIKVKLFHSSITDEQLEKIETVINETFKVCQKYKIVPGDTNVNFRMFLFEDREQYADMRKSLHDRDVTPNELGVTRVNVGADASIALADVSVYTEDNFRNYSKSFEKIDYLTLSHEFVHCVQNIARPCEQNLVMKE